MHSTYYCPRSGRKPHSLSFEQSGWLRTEGSAFFRETLSASHWACVPEGKGSLLGCDKQTAGEPRGSYLANGMIAIWGKPVALSLAHLSHCPLWSHVAFYYNWAQGPYTVILFQNILSGRRLFFFPSEPDVMQETNTQLMFCFPQSLLCSGRHHQSILTHFLATASTFSTTVSHYQEMSVAYSNPSALTLWFHNWTNYLT